MKTCYLLIGIAALNFTSVQAAPITAAPPPGLEEFISYAFHSDLISSKTGDGIAWIEVRKGVRNVWVATGPDFRPRQITKSTDDDGQELTNLTWSPDGKTIVWVRGGDHHRNGWAASQPPPNPASAIEQPLEEIWAANVTDGYARKIANGDLPAISSNGQIAFIKDGQAWTLGDGVNGASEKLFYDRGRVNDLKWSPDGNKLAFVSMRGDHSFIGVYERRAKQLVWLSPATAWDADPTWAPDGQKIAFSRRVGASEGVPSMLVEAPNPFSIMVGTVSTGSAATAWTSPNTANGSYPEVPDGIRLMWTAGDRLTFRAELDGWPHLYSLPTGGGTPMLLTPGNYMVEHVSLSADQRSLLYSANFGSTEGDVDRRHLYKVSVDRPGPTALTSGAGLEWTPVPVGNDKIAYVSVTATTPTRITVAKSDGRMARKLDTPGADYSVDAMVVPKHITYRSPDGILVHGQLFSLAADGSKKPAIIYVHGGPSRQMLLGWSYMDYYAHSYAMNQYLASRGFVVLSVNYRLGIGYGRDFQHADRGGLAGASEYQDVLEGARFLQRLPQVDRDRIGIWGGSYGGLLTAQALGRNSEIFKAGVDLHGVHDWSFYTGKVPRPERYEQGDYSETLKSAFESSPVADIKNWKSPILFIHGDADGNVPFNQTSDLARRLAAKGVPYEELILPNEVHGFLRYESWLKSDTATVHFLEEKLKP